MIAGRGGFFGEKRRSTRSERRERIMHGQDSPDAIEGRDETIGMDAREGAYPE
jgi:hypothetical protein